MRDHTRLFSNVYSCTAQRELSSAQADWRQQYLVQLRFDALASKAIVVPDIYLFDGRYFLDRDPVELCKQISRDPDEQRLPIEVRSRAATLEQSLAEFLFRKDSDYLSGFPFNAIDGESERTELAAILSGTRRERLQEHLGRGGGTVPQNLASFLRGLGAREETVARFEGGWSRWLQAESDGLIQVRPWDRHFDLAAALVADRIDDDVLTTDVGRRFHAEVLAQVTSGRTFRADVTTRLVDLRAEPLSETAALELATLEDWYTLARHRALAAQHDADFAHTQRPEVMPVGPLRRLADSIEDEGLPAGLQSLILPDGMLPGLAQLDGAQFGRVCVENARSLESWWQSSDTGALRNVIEHLNREVERTGKGGGAAEPTSLIQVMGRAVLTMGAAASSTHPVIAAGAVVLLTEGVVRGVRSIQRAKATRRVVEQLWSRTSER